MAVATRAVTGEGRRPKVLQGLHLGLPGRWYPILDAHELGRVPKAVRRFGLDLLLWRDSQGRPVVFEDLCPHRAAKISVGITEPGKIQGDRISCWYHGWVFDRTGAVVHVPGEDPDYPRKRGLCIRSFPAEERAGYIWMYYGTGEPAVPLTVPEELEDPAWYGFRTTVVWRTNWLNILDNLTDPMHQYVLHGRAYTTLRRPPFNRVRVAEVSDEHVRIVQQLVDEQGRVRMEEPLGFEMRLPSSFRTELLNAAPGGNVRVVMHVTPIDENQSLVFYWRGRRALGLRRLQWILVWYALYRRAVYRVAAQDEAMLSAYAPLAETRVREHLVSHDIGVIQYRRVLYRAFQKAAHLMPKAPATAEG